ncbi:uncharacterized protein LOC112566580 isoform X3 [Pomacea canaliculata]|uniref:uncharacterized protein LOC112566580 isoform X3 n=1 Tax=Pomacea canaliculata TaxID=400727 RepID=UPI000D73A3A2|nr:uncharacterized protein LOC112566580 isoform X3 [Pomacea canaliculata]
MAPTTYTSLTSPTVAMAASGTAVKITSTGEMTSKCPSGAVSSLTSANSGTCLLAGEKSLSRKQAGSGGLVVTKASRAASKKSAYKHVPHALKPVHLVAKRNARERRRVQAVNSAFVRLRKHVPYEPRHKRLSKVKTLRVAISYIAHLQDLIREHDRRVASCHHHHHHHHDQHNHHLGLVPDTNAGGIGSNNNNNNNNCSNINNNMVDDVCLISGRVGVVGGGGALGARHPVSQAHPPGHLLHLRHPEDTPRAGTQHAHSVWVETAQFMPHPDDSCGFKHLATTPDAAPYFISPCQATTYEATPSGFLPFNGYPPQNPCQLSR